ncbi:MAG: hypothetical protein ACXIT4_09425 [Erythrobacter sp.]
MPRLCAFKAPLALALLFAASAGQAGPSASQGYYPAAADPEGAPANGTPPPLHAATPGLGSPLAALLEQLIANQVRIQQRVVVRISPQPMAARQELAAQTLERELVSRYEEKRMGKCIPLEGIAAVRTGGGTRLVLFLRDQRMVSLSLEKSCHARDFYSGFYVERHQDGQLCVDRDRLQSRTGVQCEVARIRQLVETGK